MKRSEATYPLISQADLMHALEQLGFETDAVVAVIHADHNDGRIRALQPGLSYLICHPAQAGDELTAITDTAHQRDFERTYFGGDEGRAALAGAGVHTIGMRPLRDLLRPTA